MQQSTLGAFVLALLAVLVISVSDYGAPIALHNVAAVPAVSTPAPSGGTTGGGSPDGSTTVSSTGANSSSSDQKPPETGSSTKCPEGADCKESKVKEAKPVGACVDPINDKVKKECEAQKTLLMEQKSRCTQGTTDKDKCKPYEIDSGTYDADRCQVKIGGQVVNCKKDVSEKCPTYSSTFGNSCAWDDKRPECQCSEGGNSQPTQSDQANNPSCKGLTLAECKARGIAVDVATDTSGGNVGPGASSSSATQGAQTAFQNGGGASQTAVSQPTTSGGSTTTATSASGGGASTSAPKTNGQSNPVHSGGGGVNPAASGGTAGVGGTGTGGGNYGPLSGGYDSFKQYQPYSGSNNGLSRIADNFGQQPSYGYNQNYGNAYTQPTATTGRGGLGGAIGNFINNLVGNNSSAPTPAPAQGVVFYGGQPVASYTTKDGSIVIDKVRVPRQTPQGNNASPDDLVQALSASDVSVAARIRSEVASGTLTLAIPTGGDGVNQAYTNIQNLIVEDEVQAALQVAEDAGIAAKDSVNCEVHEVASDCLARRIATAQEVERRVFVDELHRRALEPNAVAHFVGVYDNVANPGSGQQYSGASQSVLSQLNNPSTSVVGTVVDAVGAAIDSVVSFIANLF